ncbi:MAG TPA: protein-glutamate O-methyltransferase CheR [Phycisphaerae bacterium]|nr:protein-glutamate O-methyltransferase CheR [Phycisphaerae bacterium]
MLNAEWTLSDADFRLITGMVYDHCGITLNESKRDLVQARLSKELRAGGYQTVEQYVRMLMADQTGARFTSLIDALSTNLTSFFREPEHFQYLTSTLVPGWVAARGNATRRIVAWSAACSSGEEPYTLGIALSEALVAAEQAAGRSGAAVDSISGPGGWDVRILATDISTRVLGTAKAGIYPSSRLGGISPEHRQAYFGRCDPSFLPHRGRGKEEVFQVRPFLRSMIRFRHLNLMEGWPFSGPFDVIFCRNVMIYFDKPTQERLVNRFHDCLAPGGYLFTGHSESLTGIRHTFQYVKPTIYRRS